MLDCDGLIDGWRHLHVKLHFAMYSDSGVFFLSFVILIEFSMAKQMYGKTSQFHTLIERETKRRKQMKRGAGGGGGGRLVKRRHNGNDNAIFAYFMHA